jgi:hypothetical protein
MTSTPKSKRRKTLRSVNHGSNANPQKTDLQPNRKCSLAVVLIGGLFAILKSEPLVDIHDNHINTQPPSPIITYVFPPTTNCLGSVTGLSCPSISWLPPPSPQNGSVAENHTPQAQPNQGQSHYPPGKPRIAKVRAPHQPYCPESLATPSCSPRLETSGGGSSTSPGGGTPAFVPSQ